jgi:hypothetical protein
MKLFNLIGIKVNPYIYTDLGVLHAKLGVLNEWEYIVMEKPNEVTYLEPWGIWAKIVYLHLVTVTNKGKLYGEVAMYILQETCWVLCERIDGIKGKRKA